MQQLCVYWYSRFRFTQLRDGPEGPPVERMPTGQDTFFKSCSNSCFSILLQSFGSCSSSHHPTPSDINGFMSKHHLAHRFSMRRRFSGRPFLWDLHGNVWRQGDLERVLLIFVVILIVWSWISKEQIRFFAALWGIVCNFKYIVVHHDSCGRCISRVAALKWCPWNKVFSGPPTAAWTSHCRYNQ